MPKISVDLKRWIKYALALVLNSDLHNVADWAVLIAEFAAVSEKKRLEGGQAWVS